MSRNHLRDDYSEKCPECGAVFEDWAKFMLHDCEEYKVMMRGRVYLRVIQEAYAKKVSSFRAEWKSQHRCACVARVPVNMVVDCECVRSAIDENFKDEKEEIRRVTRCVEDE